MQECSQSDLFPIVSVIVPNYNHAKYLEQRIQSIFCQTFRDFEIILLDDHSNDNSLEVLKKYEHHPNVSHLIVNETNSGSPFVQWQKGIQLAKGEFIWIAESDDFCSDNFLEKAVDILLQFLSVGLVSVKTGYVNSNGELLVPDKYQSQIFEIFNESKFYKGNSYRDKYLIKFNTITNVSSVLFRTKAIQNVSVPTNLRFAGDWFIYLVVLINYDIFYFDQMLNFRRYHSESHTQSTSDFWLKEHLNLRDNYSTLLKSMGLSNSEVYIANNNLRKHLYSLLAIEYAKRKSLVYSFFYLLKSPFRVFYKTLYHIIYWLFKH